jgi:bifunctional UDP-N-acetylglucosamine pyrophosphorylase/glucosamine-1-phosphate N-acetyltransferase
MERSMTRSSHPDVTALVLAAGVGKRMNSDLAKVLHPMAGRPLLAHVLDTLDGLGVGRKVVVIGHQRERVREAFAGRDDLEWAVQAEPLGTGHACMMAEPTLGEFAGTLLVVCGDTPLLTVATLDALIRGHETSGAAVTVLSMRLSDPAGYGRVVRTPDGDDIERIVEEKDATPAERQLDEVNSGIYAFSYPDLAGVLPRLTSTNAQGEYYLTDTVALLRAGGRRAAVVLAGDARELLGINTVEQLAEAETVWRAMRQGVGR